MTYLTKLFERRALEADTPINGTTLLSILGGTPAVTGKVVNPSTAMQLTAVYACVSLLSETFASLPAILYQRLKRGKERAIDHPLYPVLHDIANPEQTSADFRSTMMAHILLWGHCYAEISRNGAGKVKALWPITPTRVRPFRNSRNALMYQINLSENPTSSMPAATQNLSADRVLHVSGVLGLSPIGQAREALGLTMAAEEYGARFFSNDSTPGGVLEHPGQLSPEAQLRLRNQVEDQTRGLSNKHRMMVLEEGMKWTGIGLPPEDSQFLETRKFQVGEIARIFRVPPHMIGDVDRSTSWGTGIEQQNIGFVVYSLRSWLVRWEQEQNKTLLSEDERKNYFVEYLVDGLLRGDIQSRYQSYSIARQNGWMNGNEIRELENQNPAKGLDIYLVNGNMTPVDKAGTQPPAPAPQPVDAKQDTNQDNTQNDEGSNNA
jgi:HK97 family phage portal protein